MMHAIQLSASGVQLDKTEMRALLFALRDDGWEALGLSAELKCAELAGLKPQVVQQQPLLAPISASLYGSEEVLGDAVCKGEAMGAVLVFAPEDGEFRFTSTGESLASGGRAAKGLQVLGIADTAESAAAVADELAQVVEKVARASLDGRKTRHMKFDWEQPPAAPRKLRLLQGRLKSEGLEATYNQPSWDPEALVGAEALRDADARAFLQRSSMSAYGASSSMFAAISDMARRTKAKEDELEAIAARLMKAGLVESQHLLTCKSTSRPITRVGDLAGWLDTDAARLQCASCGREFKDEQINDGYGPTELGLQLSQKSNWMTIVVGQALMDAGVPLERILLNFDDSADEVDVVAEVFGELWMLELKDGNFELGHAYPLNYRRSAYGADRTFVVASGTVAEAAKRVLEKGTSEGGSRRLFTHPGARQANQKPVYVEGVNAIETSIGKEVEHAAGRLVRRLVAPVSLASGVDFRTVVKLREQASR